jgi:hypothetical protein
MENKKEEKKIKFKTENIFNFLFSFAILTYFFYGFYLNENSAGAGGYNGDFRLIWENLTLLKQNIIINLNSLEYSDSRPPLSYILHILLNPFTYNEEVFRFSNLLISSAIPFLLFFSIKENYPTLNASLIILLSLTVTLSPYFRTTAYWALGENYGIIFLLLSYLTYVNLKKNVFNNKNYRIPFLIFFLCLFSSLVVYFDQKLVFLPFLTLIYFFNLKIETRYKIFSLTLFFIFSLPYFYLIYLWGSLIPPSASVAREVGSSIHLFNPGYCLTILVISIFPFIFMNKLNLKMVKNIIFNKNFIFILISSLIYLTLIVTLGDFEILRPEGKGAFHKLLIVFFQNTEIRLLITVIFFLVSVIIVFIVFYEKNDLSIISYFIFLSLFTFPFYQEYLDPLMYILIFSFFKTRFNLDSSRNVYFVILYFLVFSLGSKYYYQITI